MDIGKMLGMVEGKEYKLIQNGEPTNTGTKYKIDKGILSSKYINNAGWGICEFRINQLQGCTFEEIPQPPKEYTLGDFNINSDSIFTGRDNQIKSVLTGVKYSLMDCGTDLRISFNPSIRELLGKWVIVEGE